MREKPIFLYYFSLTIFVKFICCSNTAKYPLLMPNVRPNVPDLYLCTPVKVDFTTSYYITAFEPNATMGTVHHMLVYGCSKPGSAKPVWNCGEMTQDKNMENMESAPPCSEDSQIIYAWARDAPKLDLPKDVGFKVGADSTIRYIVMQIHYAHIDHFKDGSTDDSGVFLHYTKRPLNKLAGVFLLGTGGVVPPKQIAHMETSCPITEYKTIHPFAYRVHTHSLGKVVSCYAIKPDNRWIELGKRDPLTPQMFYPVSNRTPVSYGDRLAARCTMKSTRDTPTYVGGTNKNEMCNCYLMYYVENDTPLDQKYCFSEGPPRYYWKYELEGIPDKEASTL